MTSRLGAATLLVAAALGAGPACGSRTEMFFVEPCANEGEARPCRGVCGEGAKTCANGYFGECVVPPTEQPCRNECGTGVQACIDERFRECVVPYTERACMNTCGGGIQGCTDGIWSTCEVPPIVFACETIECGPGTQTCENGVLAECDAPIQTRECSSVCGTGHETCEGGFWGPCDAPQPKPPVLTTFIRDFMESHPDFEIDVMGGGEPDTGIVEFELGADDKPVYQSLTERTRTTTGRDNFNQWYRDVPGVNITEQLDLPLAPSTDIPGFFVYHDDDFFPIDDLYWGNEGHPHNYHFTLEAKTTFEYRGGETFLFTGDDDMWVFINRRLAIDLGGLHSPRSANIDLDGRAAELGISIGNVYTLHFFFAERHTVQSTFNIETLIAEPGSCD